MNNFVKDDSIIKNGYLLFWRGYLSNWYPSSFRIDNITYNCMEQYMMASKAALFKDDQSWEKIMNTYNPKEQKDFGRKVKNYKEEVWNKERYAIVLSGTLEKYKQNKELLKQFLDTEENIFVEASPLDGIWGIKMDKEDPDAIDPTKWKGLNLLGQVLTEARNILRNNAKNKIK